VEGLECRALLDGQPVVAANLSVVTPTDTPATIDVLASATVSNPGAMLEPG
jgi:hypothetical protein